MRKWMRIGLVAAVILAVASAAGVTMAGKPAGDQKEVKEFPLYGEIRGSLTGSGALSAPIKVELSRMENGQLVPVESVMSKLNGDYEFGALQPGLYIVTPALESLPDGMGLYLRHAQVQVHQDVAAVELRLGRVKKLDLVAPGRVDAGQPFAVEAHAYDTAGEHLFAAIEVVASGEAEVVEHGLGQAKLKAKAAGRPVTVEAHHGQLSAKAEIKVGD